MNRFSIPFATDLEKNTGKNWLQQYMKSSRQRRDASYTNRYPLLRKSEDD